MEKHSLWRNIIAATFGLNDEEWITKCVKGGYGVALWEICKGEWEEAARNTGSR